MNKSAIAGRIALTVMANSSERCITASSPSKEVTTSYDTSRNTHHPSTSLTELSVPDEVTDSDIFSTGFESEQQSSEYSILIPVIVAAITGAAAVIYGIGTFKSYQRMKQENGGKSSCTMIANALRNPLYFRYSHAPEPEEVELQQEKLIAPVIL